MRAWILFLALAGALHFFATPGYAHHLNEVSAGERRDYIRRGQVWLPTDISSKDLFAGPQNDDSFAFNETVECDYVKRPRRGTSPKFYCKLESGDVVKVRYGQYNNEVYGQVAASRLLWALGFGAQANYPVRIQCNGCSSDPWLDPDAVSQSVMFDTAIIERPIRGESIHEEGFRDQGWNWNELQEVDSAQGGATRAQIDAFKLLAAFITHVDSRADNQELICPQNAVTRDDARNDAEERCDRPMMYIRDLGTTFGGAYEEAGFSTLNLRHWKKWPVWKDAKKCIADLEPSESENIKLRNPKIGEEGRSFLADLLVQLSDQQIYDLFSAAKADEVDQNPGSASIGDWVQAFKERRDEIVLSRCNTEE
jgi:hypothetical protein